MTGNINFPLSPLRLTGGVFANNNEVSLTSQDTGGQDIELGGIPLPPDVVGTLTGRTYFEDYAPYLGVGFDFEPFDKFGLNLDIGWIALQREYPPVAVHKVRKQLLHVHVRDIDGMMRSFPHIGQGVMDFEAVSEALRQIGYHGAVSLEQDKHPGDMAATCRTYLKTMRDLLG